MLGGGGRLRCKGLDSRQKSSGRVWWQNGDASCADSRKVISSHRAFEGLCMTRCNGACSTEWILKTAMRA